MTSEKELSLANTARSLAKQFPPQWSIPTGLQDFTLPNRDLAEYTLLYRETTLLAMRDMICNRLEAIEDGTYYAVSGIGIKSQRVALDRAEAYHRLWWLDMFIGLGRK